MSASLTLSRSVSILRADLERARELFNPAASTYARIPEPMATIA